eukprot:gene6020-12133_t
MVLKSNPYKMSMFTIIIKIYILSIYPFTYIGTVAQSQNPSQTPTMVPTVAPSVIKYDDVIMCELSAATGAGSTALFSSWRCTGNYPNTVNVCSGPSTSTWRTVVCSGGVVVSISLSGAGAVGSIPTSVSKLTSNFGSASLGCTSSPTRTPTNAPTVVNFDDAVMCELSAATGAGSTALFSSWQCTGNYPNTVNVCSGPSTSTWRTVVCSGGVVVSISLSGAGAV